MAILPKLAHRINRVPAKSHIALHRFNRVLWNPISFFTGSTESLQNPILFFTEIKTSNLKLRVKTQKIKKKKKKTQKIPNSQSNPDQKENHTNVKLYYRATVIKTAWYWYKNRSVWRRIEDPEIISCGYSHLRFYKKKCQKHTLRKDDLCSKWHWVNWIPTCRQMKLDPCL